MGYKILNTGAPNYDTTGWSEKTGQTDHTLAMAWIEGLDVAALEYTRKDCREAAAWYPESHKASHYLDLALYCDQRLNKLRKK